MGTRRLVSALGAVAVLTSMTGAAAVATASGAEAAGGCYGTRVAANPMKSGGQTAGRAELWYSPANGGTNCVIVYDKAGGRHYIGAFLKRAGAAEWKKDKGYFQYYAGPVRLTNMNGKCVDWAGQTKINGRMYEMTRYRVHCG